MTNYLTCYFPSYFLLGWTANLGVVPLFLFSALRLAPIFFFLLTLLFSVTLVLETITIPSELSKMKKFNPLFLLESMSYVKKTLFFSLIFLSCFHTLDAMGQVTVNPKLPTSITLAKGEHQELVIDNLKSFSVGNSEIIAHHYNENNKILLIRGKSLGTSEIMLWFKDGKSEKINVDVISKEKKQKQYELHTRLNRLGLKLEYQNLTGDINTLKNYRHFMAIIRDYPKQNWVLNGTLSDELKKEVFAKAYQAFFNHFIDDISCEERSMKIFCFYPSHYKIEKSLEKYLIYDLGVILSKISGNHRRKNYRLKLKIFQFEASNGRDISFGLDRLNVALSAIVNDGTKALVGENVINIGEQKVYISTLAEPETIVHFGGEAMIQVGGEIPYASAKSMVNNVSVTEWKFAGLKLKMHHSFEEGLHLIKYETEFTRPAGDGVISGSKEGSSIMMSENDSRRIFQIGYQTQMEGMGGIPYLSSIPILGELFKSRNNQNSYKYITGILTFAEAKEDE